HFLTQIPQPMQRNSDMKAILSVGFTSIQSLPERPIVSHTFLHSCAQRLGLQRLSSTIAIRVILSAIGGGDESKCRPLPHRSSDRSLGPAPNHHVALIRHRPPNTVHLISSERASKATYIILKCALVA
ncbi:hypothetical protein EDB84DRAFT_1268002, partial [Lactarius hengduanensis]